MTKHIKIVLLIYGILLTIASAFVVNQVVSGFTNPKNQSNMFMGYRMGYMMAHEELRKHIYDFDAQTAVDQAVHGKDIPLPISFCNHPPTTFLVMAPFAYLPFDQSCLCYGAIAFLLTSAGLYALWRLCTAEAKWLPLVFLPAALISSFPGAISTYYLSHSLLLPGVFGIFFYASEKRRDVFAGLMLALLFLKPNYALAAAAYPIARWRPKVLIVAGLTVFAWGIATACVVGWNNVLDYAKVAVYADLNFPGVFPEKMVCIRAILDRVVVDSVAIKLSSALSLLAFVWLVWAFRSRKGKEATHSLISLTAISALFISVHSHVYESVMLIIPFTIAAATLLSARLPSGFVERLNLALAISFPLISWLPMILLGGQFYYGSLSFNLLMVCTWSAQVLRQPGGKMQTPIVS